MDIQEWVPTDRLGEWVYDATERLLETLDDFTPTDDRWMCPYLPVVNPPIWEIAHVAWFAEWFVLRELHGHEPLMDHVDARYDSAKVPHRTRWQLSYPDATTTRDYVRRVGDALVDVVENDRGLDSTHYYVAYAITHHDAHTEALTYTRQTLDWGARISADHAATRNGTPPAGLTGDRTVPGGEHLLGASRTQPFVMDNEKWAHRVHTEDVSMSVLAVTLSEFAAFVDAGGYDDARLWSPAGWAWRSTTGATHPVYWRRGESGWEHRRVDAWRPVSGEEDLPVSHVCFWEAEAFCNWAARRLPTEAEWEVAATTAPSGGRSPWFPWGSRDPRADEANLDANAGGVVPVTHHSAGDGPWGHRQLIGNVWEWTSSIFGPYPHFEPDAYRDNSEPWFGTRKVLKGGSWATRNRYVRSTYRNFFEPDRRDVIAGFRTCAR